MTVLMNPPERQSCVADASIGRIVSVTGSKAIVLLDGGQAGLRGTACRERPEMGTLLAIDTAGTMVLAIVSALSVPGPGAARRRKRDLDRRAGLVGELWKRSGTAGRLLQPRRHIYPALGDRVRVASKAGARAGVLRRRERSVRVGCISPGPLYPRHGPRRRPARQAFRHPRHHRHRQVLHDGADPALDPREESGRAHRPARSAQRIRAPPSPNGAR